MADALRERLEAEQRVTADIAHELRTPVTGLVTAAELLPPSRPAELVRDRVGALRSLVEDILEVARLDSATEQAELVAVPLGEFVSRRVPGRRMYRDAETVRTDPRRLERVLVNLLQNAERHGAPPVRSPSRAGRSGYVTTAPASRRTCCATGPSRFRTADPNRSDGHGLGLTIAMAQARVLSAELTLANAVDGGAEVTLALPSAP